MIAQGKDDTLKTDTNCIDVQPRENKKTEEDRVGEDDTLKTDTNCAIGISSNQLFFLRACCV